MKSFKNWNFEEVEDTFGIEKVENHPILKEWLSSNFEPNEVERDSLTHLQQKLRREVDILNEEELKFRFIGELINKIDFFNPEYRYFLDRKLGFKKEGELIEGKVDFMVARGKQTPKEPFFFLHEYKKEKGYSDDPLGQLLVAMIAAQTHNQNEHPIYGAYVVGRFWFFVILEGKEYAVSLAYDTTRKAIFEVFGLLKAVKNYIDEYIRESKK
ncbi:MAG: hypothetical protein ACPGVB_05465 [Chitinophagales bacterium]